MHLLKVQSSAREQLIDITRDVQAALARQGTQEGHCLLFVRHTTAGLTINENADPDVPRDLLHALRTLIPQHGMGFQHNEENSDAHLKASLMGPSLTIPVYQGKLMLGTWQGIFFCEFDGPRERQVVLMVR